MGLLSFSEIILAKFCFGCILFYMKTIKVEVPVELARRMLSDFETQISGKIRNRDELNTEIAQLEASANALRAELKNGNTDGGRPVGENKTKIREYLTKLAENKGARASEISKATGIGPSSMAFTLKGNPKDFVRDETTKRWKLVI